MDSAIAVHQKGDLKMQIGQKVTSSYQGITGTVVGYSKPFMDIATIVVEYVTPVLGTADKTMVTRRTFLTTDFYADQ